MKIFKLLVLIAALFGLVYAVTQLAQLTTVRGMLDALVKQLVTSALALLVMGLMYFVSMFLSIDGKALANFKNTDESLKPAFADDFFMHNEKKTWQIFTGMVWVLIVGFAGFALYLLPDPFHFAHLVRELIISILMVVSFYSTSGINKWVLAK